MTAINFVGIADIGQREIANGAVTYDFTTTEVGAMGSMDMAYERGNFEFFNESNEVVKHGRYMGKSKLNYD